MCHSRLPPFHRWAVCVDKHTYLSKLFQPPVFFSYIISWFLLLACFMAHALLCALVWLRLSVWVSDIILHGGFGVNQHLYILNATQREFLKPAELFCHFMLLFISFVCQSFFCERASGWPWTTLVSQFKDPLISPMAWLFFHTRSARTNTELFQHLLWNWPNVLRLSRNDSLWAAPVLICLYVSVSSHPGFRYLEFGCRVSSELQSVPSLSCCVVAARCSGILWTSCMQKLYVHSNTCWRSNMFFLKVRSLVAVRDAATSSSCLA